MGIIGKSGGQRHEIEWNENGGGNMSFHWIVVVIYKCNGNIGWSLLQFTWHVNELRVFGGWKRDSNLGLLYLSKKQKQREWNERVDPNFLGSPVLIRFHELEHWQSVTEEK